MSKLFSSVREYFAEFRILKEVPREFWNLNLIVNFFEMLAYFTFITILSLYLTNNLGFDDETTGDIMGAFSFIITIVIFFAGPIIDTVGIKRALVISMAILVPTRFFLGATDFIEEGHLRKTVDTEAAAAEIEKGGYHLRAFTTDAESMTEAQVDLALLAQGRAGDRAAGEDLRGDPARLRTAVVQAMAANAGMTTRWEQKLRAQLTERVGKLKADPAVAADPVEAGKLAGAEKALAAGFAALVEEGGKETAVWKEMVADLVATTPQLAGKFIFDVPGLSGEAKKDAVVKTILSFTELRRQFSLMPTLQTIVLAVLVLIALGEALMVPAIYVGIRRFTNKRTSGTGFNFQYLSMNVGAILAGVSIDFWRGWLGNLAGNEAILLMGGVFAVVCTIGAVLLRTNIEVRDDGQVVVRESDVYGEKGTNPLSIMAETMKEAAFWRFMLFLVLLVGVKLVFTHQFMVMPKYYERVLGADAPLGLLNAINPSIIVIGLILFIPVIARFNVFNLIIVGTFFSALSVFALVIPGRTFGEALGTTIENGYLYLILAQIVIFAIGEVIWSPRLSEYTVVIAPKGREGTYMSLAALPMFIAKPLNGFISGRLLDRYCPSDVMDGIVTGSRTFWNGPEMMWLIFALIAIASPILVLALRRVIEQKRAD